MSFEKLNRNHKRTIKEGVVLDEMPFKKLKEFKGKQLRVDGFFFTNGDYGKQVVVVANGCKINMPARAVADFEQIYNDDEMLNAVLNGDLLIKDIKEVKAKMGKTISYVYETYEPF